MFTEQRFTHGRRVCAVVSPNVLAKNVHAPSTRRSGKDATPESGFLPHEQRIAPQMELVEVVLEKFSPSLVEEAPEVTAPTPPPHPTVFSTRDSQTGLAKQVTVGPYVMGLIVLILFLLATMGSYSAVVWLNSPTDDSLETVGPGSITKSKGVTDRVACPGGRKMDMVRAEDYATSGYSQDVFTDVETGESEPGRWRLYDLETRVSSDIRQALQCDKDKKYRYLLTNGYTDIPADLGDYWLGTRFDLSADATEGWIKISFPADVKIIRSGSYDGKTIESLPTLKALKTLWLTKAKDVLSQHGLEWLEVATGVPFMDSSDTDVTSPSQDERERSEWSRRRLASRPKPDRRSIDRLLREIKRHSG